MKIIALKHTMNYFNVQYRPISYREIWLSGISQYWWMSVRLPTFKREVFRFLLFLHWNVKTVHSFLSRPVHQNLFLSTL